MLSFFLGIFRGLLFSRRIATSECDREQRIRESNRGSAETQFTQKAFEKMTRGDDGERNARREVRGSFRVDGISISSTECSEHKDKVKGTSDDRGLFLFIPVNNNK